MNRDQKFAELSKVRSLHEKMYNFAFMGDGKDMTTAQRHNENHQRGRANTGIQIDYLGLSRKCHLHCLEYVFRKEATTTSLFFFDVITGRFMGCLNLPYNRILTDEELKSAFAKIRQIRLQKARFSNESPILVGYALDKFIEGDTYQEVLSHVADKLFLPIDCIDNIVHVAADKFVLGFVCNDYHKNRHCFMSLPYDHTPLEIELEDNLVQLVCSYNVVVAEACNV